MAGRVVLRIAAQFTRRYPPRRRRGDQQGEMWKLALRAQSSLCSLPDNLGRRPLLTVWT
jgi:hypothetical protein